MLSKLYAFTFAAVILGSLWYQRRYLHNAEISYNAKLFPENNVLPTSRMEDFNMRFFENGFLKYSFQGKVLTYYSDAHFEASGNLIYKEYDLQEALTTIVKTENAYGEFDTQNSSDPVHKSTTILNHKKLKSLLLPNQVNFWFHENRGNTKKVYLDVMQQSINTTENVVTDGKNGHLEGTGFTYNSKTQEFILHSNVHGILLLPQKD